MAKVAISGFVSLENVLGNEVVLGVGATFGKADPARNSNNHTLGISTPVQKHTRGFDTSAFFEFPKA